VALDGLVEAALSLTGGREVLALAPDYDAGLGPALVRAGFKEEADFVCMARRLTKEVAELSNEQAKEAIPAG
jgi:hypothetical protein